MLFMQLISLPWQRRRCSCCKSVSILTQKSTFLKVNEVRLKQNLLEVDTMSLSFKICQAFHDYF